MKFKICLSALILVFSAASMYGQPLSGTKTIGGSSPDYATFTDAINAIIAQGQSGDLIFNIRTGVYNEHITLPSNFSSYNTTFQSETGVNTDVILTYAPASNPENYTILLDGCDNVTFQNMTISSTGTSYARVIIMYNGANNNSFINNRIIGVSTTSDLSIYNLVDSYTSQDQNNEFSGNYLKYGSYGFYFHGISTGYENSNKINGNILEDQYEAAIYSKYQNGLFIHDNHISTTSSNTGYMGIYLLDGKDPDIARNKIILNKFNGGLGIYIVGDGGDDGDGFIENNFVVIKTYGNNAYGIYLHNCRQFFTYSNSVLINGSNSASRCLTIAGNPGSNNNFVRNNIFANDAGGYAFYCDSYLGVTTDFNNLISFSGNIGYWNGIIADLTSWKAATGQSQNSISVDPFFLDETDLHVSNLELKVGYPPGGAMPTTDIDGDTRDPSTPCIGADEFVYPAMAGIYTIGSSGNDFTNFNEAVSALINGGVRGEVIIEAMPGTYTEQITIPAIKWIRSDRQVKFRSSVQDSTQVILTYSPSSTGDNYTVMLDSAYYLSFEKITFTTGGTTYGGVLKIIEGGNQIRFSNNRIIGNQTAATNDGKLVDARDGKFKTHIVFKDNYFKNGTAGLDFSNAGGTGMIVEGNYFEDLTFWNIRMVMSDSMFVNSNTMNSSLTTEFYGMNLFLCDSGLQINNNRLYAPVSSAATGIYLDVSNAATSRYSLVSNNYIHINTTGASGRGIYNRESNQCKYYNNSVEVTGSLGTSQAFYIRTSAENILIRNNIISNKAIGYGIYSEVSDFGGSDYNNLYTNGSNLAFYNSTNQSSLTAWQSASGQDTNSLSVDPQLPAADDPHFPNPLLNDSGTPVAEVTEDIDGEMRDPANPDIGSDEFCLPPTATNKVGCTVGLVQDLTATGSNIKWYSDAGLTNHVWPGSSFPTGHTEAGSYNYYATQTINESESQGEMVTLTIYTTPGPPSTTNETICFGETTPELTATGTSLLWFSDESLTNQVNTGTNFGPGETDPGDYVYYVTQTSNGCESDAETSTITINPKPDAPMGGWTVICEEDSLPPLVTSGSNILWFGDEELTNLVHEGDTFNTGLTGPGIYAYWITQTVLGCQSYKMVDSIWIKPLPSMPAVWNNNICFGEDNLFLEASGTNITWYSDANLTSVITNVDTSFLPDQTGIGEFPFYATQTVNGCEGHAAIAYFTIHRPPDALVMDDKAICQADTQFFQIGPDETYGHSYNWVSDIDGFIGTEHNPSVRPIVTTEYTLTETIDSTGCHNTNSVIITINPDPEPNVLADQEHCRSDNRPFQIGSSAIAGHSYSWTSDPEDYESNEANPTVTPPVSITYILTETIDAAGCDNSDSVSFIINENPVAYVLEDNTICQSEIQSYNLGGDPVAGNTYSWTSDPGDFTSDQSNPQVTPTLTTTYTLTEEVDETECEATNSLTITINPNPEVSITADQNPIDQGNSTVLNASAKDDYLWSPVTGLNNYTGQQVNASPGENITYYLVGTNEFGCKGYDTLDLFVNCLACAATQTLTKPGEFNYGCSGQNLYKNNLTCSWTLYPDAISKIYLYFDPEKFDIKPGDWVVVYDGSNSSADTLGKFNNNHPPSGNIVGGSQMFIEFITDDSITGTGFQAEWSGDPNISSKDPGEKNINIYPNPANDILYVELYSSISEDIYINIYNNLGQLVLNRKIPFRPGLIREEFSLQDWKAGIFFVQLINGDQVVKRKIVKE